MNFLQVYMRRLFILVFLLSFSRFITAEDVITIAVLDFEGLGISEMETRALTNRLRGNLVKTGEYQVIERGKMDEILEEQGFQLSGCTSEGCIVEAGQLLGVEMMLAGSFSLVGATYSVEMRLIDIETGTITKSANFDMRGELVKWIVDKHLQPGYYEMNWDGHNNAGQQVASGLYLYRMQAGTYVKTRKMVLMK